MENSKLTEIRCPFQRTGKNDGITRNCKHLCVKVYAPSAGETWCSRCDLVFEFEVDAQSTQTSNIRVKSVKDYENI